MKHWYSFLVSSGKTKELFIFVFAVLLLVPLFGSPDVYINPEDPNYKAGVLVSEVHSIAKTRVHEPFDGYIEVVEVRAIDKGVEAYVRAWDENNMQYGFGIDGSVEIERIRIINPPLYVPNENEQTAITKVDEFGKQYVQPTYKRDSRGALKQMVGNIVLRLTKTQGNITMGKVGRTVTTIFSSSGDGWVENDANADWNIVHDDTDGVSASDTDTTVRIQAGSQSGTYRIRRAFVPFDTSSIPDADTISSATIDLYITAITNGDNDADDFIVMLTGSTRTSTTNVITTDADNCGDAIDSPTEGSNQIDLGAMTIGSYSTFTLNATGIADISKTGVTDTCWREGHDVLDIVPAGSGNQMRFSSSEEVGTTQDPFITITHSTPGLTGTRVIRLLGIRLRGIRLF